MKKTLRCPSCDQRIRVDVGTSWKASVDTGSVVLVLMVLLGGIALCIEACRSTEEPSKLELRVGTSAGAPS